MLLLSNQHQILKGMYLNLTEFTGGMDVQKEKVQSIISGD